MLLRYARDATAAEMGKVELREGRETEMVGKVGDSHAANRGHTAGVRRLTQRDQRGPGGLSDGCPAGISMGP